MEVRVNAWLASEAIPEVNDDVLHWRMTILIHDIKGWLCKVAFFGGSLTEFDYSVAKKSATAGTATPPSASGSQLQQSPSLPYDPVRDAT